MRILHTMLRVGDLQRSVRFYTEVLGMKLLRTTERPEQKYSLAFVGYDTEERSAVIELTYNYGVERYEMGGAFGHIAIGVPDVAGACAKVRGAGGKVTREPGPVKGGGSVIAFVEDPDGYKIEFIEKARVVLGREILRPQLRIDARGLEVRLRVAHCAASCAAPRTPGAAGLRRSAVASRAAPCAPPPIPPSAAGGMRPWPP